ncbi:phage baseplate protein [Treponema sp.]|uniref:phage baseplate protein n=1 Tax=Treponema sp. TaxID=166 RepID=UPI003FD85716
MISTQTFENYPEFANAGQKSQPNDAKYAAGFIPSDVLPAEWLNWFLSGATKGVTALNTGVKSIEQEINAVLESRSVTPDINTTNQLLTVLNKIKAEAVLAAHPVGSLYWTSKNENPAVTFGGGTWKQITDKFVLAAGSTYKAEATGGAATVALTVANLPSHNHSYTPSGRVSSTFKGTSHSHTFTPSGTVTSTFKGSSHSHTFTPSGSISDTTASGSISSSGKHNHVLNDPGHKHRIPGYWSSFAGGDYNVLHEGGYGNLNTTTEKTGITINEGGIHTHTFHGDPHTHSFTGTKQTVSATQGGTVSSSFTGKQQTVSATQDGTVSSSFTGNSGNTGSVGSGSSINIMPPYVVKYCWERTA